MPISIKDRRSVPEAASPAGRLTFKTADVADPAGQMLAMDEAEGIVTAVVSVTGVEDEVADIIEPGAYRETLTKRRPKVCWAHSWEHPIGRVLHIEELPPGDERLPAQTRDGKAWPKAAGALVATMQFNMRSTEGKQAFEAVRFYSETGECEYSIGYQVPMGKAARNPKTGVRHIKALDLYELSVVLFGAHTMTGTLSIKDALAAAVERKDGKVTIPRIRTAQATLDLAQGKSILDEGIDWEALGETKDILDRKGKPDEEVGKPDHSDSVMVAVYPDGTAADAVYSQIAGPDENLERDELHVTLAYLGKVTGLEMDADEVVDAVTGAVEGIPVLTGQIGGIGQFPDEGDGAPTWAPVDVPGLSMLREQIASALGDDVASDHGFTPHMTLGYDIGLVDPIDPTPVTFSAVRVVYGTEQYDISLGGDGLPVEGKTAAVDEVGTYIDGLTDDDWQTIEDTDGADEGKAITPGGRSGDDSPVGTPGGRQNWVDKAGGLPKYIRMVAHALERRGFSKSRAIATAVNTMRRWAAGGNKVTPKVQAAAAAALAEWEKMKASSGGGKKTAYDPAADVKTAVYDPALDLRAVGYSPDLDVKSGGAIASTTYPYLPGTYEARQDAIRRAVNEALRGEPTDDDGDKFEWDDVDIRATWDDRVIATRRNWGHRDDRQETFEMTYSIGPDGIVILGEPDPVELQVVAVGTGDDDVDDYHPLADALPLADMVKSVTLAVRTSRGSLEAKAGRVLSGRNERRLRTAVQGLLDVLAAAGVDIDPGGDRRDPGHDLDVDGDGRRDVDPSVDIESTAPSASGRKSLTLADVEADLAALGL